MKKIILFITLLAFLPFFLLASPIKKAQKAMDKYDYSQAIGILKKAVDNDKYNKYAVPMLAKCYRMQRDIFNTKAWYARAIALPDVKPETYLYYGQALLATGEYSAARDIFLKYANLSTDGRGKMFATHCDSVLNPWKNLKPFFEVKTVKNINSDQSDFGPAFYNGYLIFASDFVRDTPEQNRYGWTGRGYLDIMKSDPFAPGEFWNEMNTPTLFNKKFDQVYHDGPANFSADGNSIFFTRSYKDKAKKKNGFKTNLLKIYYSSKINGEWGEVKPFFLNSTEYSIGHPALSPDGQTLYFASDMPGGYGGTDIWMCKRMAENWSPAVNLGKTINTSENEMFPYIKEDGVLYFTSAGHPGYGALDIFKSTNINGEWTTPENLHPPINSSFDDFALAYEPRKNNGFFSSNRPGGAGNDDIYAFRGIITALEETPAEITEKPSYISGIVKDKVSLKPIEGATVFAYNPNTGKVLVLKTGPDGVYKAPVERPAEFVVKGMKPAYIADCTPFPVMEINPGTTINAPRDLLLDKLELNRVFRIDNIYYDFDKYSIRADAKPELDKLVTIMMENPINVELGSHTDCRGTTSYNDRLSQNRATAAIEYIIFRGIAQSRIIAKGYGEHQLTNKCADGVFCSEEDHQLNRRTEFKVIEYSSPQQQVGQFNPNLFNNGELLDIRLMPEGFFGKCAAQQNTTQSEKQYLPEKKPIIIKDSKVVTPPIQPIKIVEPTDSNKEIKDFYTVQIASESISPAQANSIPGIMAQKGKDGVTRYYVGQFHSPKEAESLKNEMIKKGFKTSWIVKMDENRPLK